MNGIVAHIGQVVDPETDEIKFSDKIIADQADLVYYVFNKPRDVVTTCLSGKDDEDGIMDVVDIPERVFPIGRLDKETTGLIILTNDGRLSNYLMHLKDNGSRTRIIRRVGGKDTVITRKYMTKPCEITRLSSSKFAITLREGKNRQIRRMVEVVGCDVKKLKRIRVENVML